MGSEGKDWLKEMIEKYPRGLMESVRDAAGCASVGGKWEEFETDGENEVKYVAACFESATTTTTTSTTTTSTTSTTFSTIPGW